MLRIKEALKNGQLLEQVKLKGNRVILKFKKPYSDSSNNTLINKLLYK